MFSGFICLPSLAQSPRMSGQSTGQPMARLVASPPTAQASPFDLEVYQPQFDWDRVSSADSYVVEYWYDGVTNSVTTADNSVSVILVTADPAPRVFAHVKAVNNFGSSPWSPVRFYPAYPPDRVTIGLIGATVINLQISTNYLDWRPFTNGPTPFTIMLQPGLNMFKKLSPTNKWYLDYWNPANL